ncbi:MAG: ATP-binding cassette domain-containing protein [Armatimonadetes bacterium]|nr:ATP-binding cassette domain-containing protein [Armatimonadota bacterium]
MIELDRVSKVFPTPQGSVTAVHEVSFEVEAGETLCLIGTSGSGKTTTMKMINRLIEPTRGTVRLAGKDVQDLDLIRLRRQIGYVIQKGGLFPHLTVERNVGLLCELEGWLAAKTRERVHQLLELVNLSPHDYAARYPEELSGGQRQRVGVARALALDPGTILMDEPFGALDPITREQIHQEFLQLRREVKKTIILVTHDMAEAFDLGDRVALMDEGRLVQIGTQDDFRDRPASEFVVSFLKRHLASPADRLVGQALDLQVPIVRDRCAELLAVRADEEGRFLGVVHEGALLPEAVIADDSSLKEALQSLLEQRLPALAVIDARHRVLGAVTPRSLLGRIG